MRRNFLTCSKRLTARVSCLSLVLVGGLATECLGSTIDFETFLGPSTFASAGNAQTLTVPTAIGNVTFQGGVILTAATNLPADQSSIYGTAGNSSNIGVIPGSGFTNPLTITFPVPITNFFLDVLNGNVINVSYRTADNNGHLADFVLIPNLSSGQKTIGFAATGNVVTIGAITGQATPTGMTWDFFIDNIHFNEALPPNLQAVPEPASLSLLALGIAGIAARHRQKRTRLRAPTA